MKKLWKATFVAALLVFAGCQEDALAPEKTEKPSEKAEYSLGLGTVPSAINEGGKWYYAGYGYHPTKLHERRLAIAPHNLYQSSQIRNPLKVELRVIDSLSELSFFTRTVVKTKKRFLFFSKTSKKVIEQRHVINTRHVMIVAKIESRVYKHLVDGTPTLSAAAQQLAKAKQYGNFLADHGAMYVKSQTLGGAVYYVYHYDMTKTSGTNKKQFEAIASAGLRKSFGLTGGRVLSADERRLVSQARIPGGVTSNVPGFAPAIIENTSDLNREIGKLQNYLNRYPQRAATMDIELASYEPMVKAPAIKNAYDQQINCLDKKIAWDALRDQLTHIRANTRANNMRTRAINALKVTNANIEKANQCVGGIPSTNGAFYPLKRDWALEKKSIALLRYHHHGIYSHYYRTWNGIGPRPHPGAGWVYEGDFTGRLLLAPEAGTRPLYTYYLPGWKTHYYSTGNPPVGYFQHKSVIGHIYTAPGPNRVPLSEYRRLTGGIWLYYYERGKRNVPHYQYVRNVGYILPSL